MELSVIHMGNSKGIRLPKALLDKYKITNQIELILEKDYIILQQKTEPRAGWKEAFKRINAADDDQFLMEDVFEDDNLDEWS